MESRIRQKNNEIRWRRIVVQPVKGRAAVYSATQALPPSARLLWSTASGFLDPGHHSHNTITLKCLFEIEVHDCHSESATQAHWFSCPCDHRLEVDDGLHGLEHGRSPLVCTKIMDNFDWLTTSLTGSKVINDSNTMKANEDAKWADFAFYDEKQCLPETAGGHNKLRWDHQLRQWDRLWCTVPSLPSSQDGCQNHRQRLQHLLIAYTEVIELNPYRTSPWSQGAPVSVDVHKYDE